jgi:diguanylate cyclase (GGDEF)-like protein
MGSNRRDRVSTGADLMPTTDRGRKAPSSGAIKRLAMRGFALSYVVALAALAGIGVLAGGSSDPVVVAAGPVVPAVLVGSGTVLGLALLFLVRRMERHVHGLEDERTGLQQAYDRARLDALIDGLTALGNHRAFQEELDHLIGAAREDGSSLALLMLDVDDLKKTNDRRGHAAGDEMLRAMAQILRANLRRGDRAFRIGGDEFAMLLPECDADGAEMVANHLLAAALSGNHGHLGSFSVTIGVTAFPDPSASRQEMALHADAALYAGKRLGRTNVQRFDPDRHGVADDSRTLVELTAAVERVAAGRLLRAVYQPVYSLQTGDVVGFEGLVRLSDEAEFADPTSLFVAADATRRTVELDVVAATAVLTGAGRLGPDQYLAINLSPRTLESDAFSPLEIVALARQHGVEPNQLVIELTEREAIEDLPRLQAAVAALHRQGVRIAIDDIGAGNAGLRLLGEVDFDIMKIDLSLVRAGARHEPSEAVLRALGTFARERGRRIVAEGIETADLLEAVLELRYDAGQGYLLGRPEPKLSMGRAALFELIADGGGDEDTSSAA